LRRDKRQHPRFTRRLEIEFEANNQNYRALTRNFSLNGMFIRTNHAFSPGTFLTMLLHLPDGSISNLKGCVRNSMKTPIAPMKNGMGIELTEKDSVYINFILSVYPDQVDVAAAQKAKAGPPHAHQPKSPSPDFVIIACPQCGVKNKINRAKGTTGHKCGKCGSSLDKLLSEPDHPSQSDEPSKPPPPDYVIIACPQCGVKNKINRAKGTTGHKCGKCKTTLQVS
jgi:ribosomal protein S27E